MIKAAVLGSPISHSLSPLLHTIAYTELGLESEYVRIDVKSGELGSFLESCGPTWSGFSLTMPLKEEVLDFASNVSPLASRILSANTLVQNPLQVWSASTTDVSGFTHALSAHGRDATGDVLVIGGGATARAAVSACDGVSTRISVMVRSLSRVKEISNCVEFSDLEFVEWGDTNLFEVADLIISTVPEGVSDSLIKNFPSKPAGIFFDVLYYPWPTMALKTWNALGGQVVDGLDLLIHQAIDQVAIFSGHYVERIGMAQLMRRHGEKALGLST
ncbi:MAG: shikimate dehydrogenase [Candidatus Planktophila sp.]|nr:shikimate dehydrogenase [Candidatus Planktophila sp.]